MTVSSGATSRKEHRHRRPATFNRSGESPVRSVRRCHTSAVAPPTAHQVRVGGVAADRPSRRRAEPHWFWHEEPRATKLAL
jgi:hypothetical protein